MSHQMCRSFVGAWTGTSQAEEKDNEYLDHIVRCTADRLAWRIHSVSRCRRIDPPAVGIRCNFLDPALCNGESYRIEKSGFLIRRLKGRNGPMLGFTPGSSESIRPNVFTLLPCLFKSITQPDALHCSSPMQKERANGIRRPHLTA